MIAFEGHAFLTDGRKAQKSKDQTIQANPTDQANQINQAENIASSRRVKFTHTESRSLGKGPGILWARVWMDTAMNCGL